MSGFPAQTKAFSCSNIFPDGSMLFDFHTSDGKHSMFYVCYDQLRLAQSKINFELNKFEMKETPVE